MDCRSSAESSFPPGPRVELCSAFPASLCLFKTRSRRTTDKCVTYLLRGFFVFLIGFIIQLIYAFPVEILPFFSFSLPPYSLFLYFCLITSLTVPPSLLPGVKQVHTIQTSGETRPLALQRLSFPCLHAFYTIRTLV